MKKFWLISLILMIVGCTNNGEIGDFYGIWSLQEFTIDGQTQQSVETTPFFWKFQNNILQISVTYSNNDYLQYTATWEHEGDKLIVDMTHYPMGVVPAELKLPAGVVATFDIKLLTSSQMQLQRLTESGEKCVYYLKKFK